MQPFTEIILSHLFREESVDDSEGLLVDGLVLVVLEVLDLVQPVALLDHVADLLSLADLVRGAEDVVDAVEDDGDGLVVSGGEEVAERLEDPVLAEGNDLLDRASGSQVGHCPRSLLLSLEVALKRANR